MRTRGTRWCPIPTAGRSWSARSRAVPLAAATEVPPAPRRPLVHASYLRLSAVYEAETRAAGALGWPVARIDGGHLHLAVAEDEVAAAILDLVAQRSP